MTSLPFALLLAAVPAAAQVHSGALQAQALPTADEWRKTLQMRAAELGLGVPDEAFVSPVSTRPTPGSQPAHVEGEVVNFQYGEMDNRLETARRVVRSKGRRRRRVIETGMTPADRVERDQIKYVVLHSALGSYDGTIGYLLRRSVAAHFMVSAQGEVTRMVDISDVANHLKNDELDAQSVGIETETGSVRAPYYTEADWEPRARWRMYAALAWLIRAISKEAGVPRDREHVMTHGEADRGLPGAHEDPGPFFDTHRYAAFEARFPGEGVTPREFLMRLVNDDSPPEIWSVVAPQPDALSAVEAVDTQKLGMARLSIFSLDARGFYARRVSDWQPPAGELPPVRASLAIPTTPGSYRVEARDLVGNITRSRLRVEPQQAPPIAGETPVRTFATLEAEPVPFAADGVDAAAL